VKYRPNQNRDSISQSCSLFRKLEPQILRVSWRRLLDVPVMLVHDFDARGLDIGITRRIGRVAAKEQQPRVSGS
jgi:hypothetical protein